MKKTLIFVSLLAVVMFLVSSCAQTEPSLSMPASSIGGSSGGNTVPQGATEVTYQGILDMLNENCLDRQYFNETYYQVNFGGQAAMDTNNDGLLDGNELCAVWGKTCVFAYGIENGLVLEYENGGSSSGSQLIRSISTCISTTGFEISSNSIFGAFCCSPE